MAELAPIRGILYDPARVSIERVIAPPDDVITESERAALEAQDPHNVVRLDGPRAEGDARTRDAQATLESWLDGGIVKRDVRPAMYRYHQVFEVPEIDRRFTRRGFVAAVRLHSYEEKVVLPHERTSPGPKLERLRLLRATRVQSTPILGLYHDPAMSTERVFAAVEARRPELEGRTADGTVHRVWRLPDRESIATVARALSALKIYIADGHDRYETSLAWRDELRAERRGQVGWRASSEFATFCLSNMADPGLVVLPTHRLIHSLPAFDREALFSRAGESCRVEPVENGARDVVRLRGLLHEAGKTLPSFALVLPGETTAWIVSVQRPPRLGLHRVQERLDAALLHALFLEELLGVKREAQSDGTHVSYVRSDVDAVARLERGEAQIAFLMNPTRVDQVRDVADAGETMPEKSTFFFPKVASGLIMNRTSPDEDLEKGL